ncbi:MAG: hypothetical protein R6X18_17760 [Chloroflexota bacterium]|jgi:hypothetical protein
MNEDSREFLAEMQNKLSTYFDGEEIETLSFVMGVDYDSLRGGTKPTKVNALLAYLGRTGRLPDLLTYVEKERHNVAWPAIPSEFELPQGVAGSESDGATIFQIGTLNTNGGAFVSGGVTTAGDFVGRDKNVQGDEINGNQYVMSGDFRGAMINIQSRLDNVTQTIQTMPSADPGQKAQLLHLVNELKSALATVPESKAQDALNLTKRVEALTEEAASDLPDPEYVQDLIESLRRAAGKVSTTAPMVASIIISIIELVNTIVT